MLLAIILLAFLMLLNGVFAMSELAMMTSRQSRLQQAARNGSKGAAAAMKLAREPTRFLSTVQVGITLIGIFAGAFGENAISADLEPLIARVPPLEPYSDVISLVVVVLLITYFSLVVGELVPKRIAMAYPEAVASFISRPLAALSVAAAIPIRLLSASTDLALNVLRIRPRHDDVSEDDVKSLLARAASTGIFTPDELKLFDRTMRTADLVVRDLMVPRRDVVWIDEDDPLDAVRVLVGTSPYSHFPVCRGSLDKVVGVVHIKDLISYSLLSGADFKVAAVAHKPLFIPETMPALRLLDQFQRSKVHIAFVVDEFGSVQGLLTINDVTSAIVGDIRRRGESPAPSMTRRDDGTWLIDGRLPLHEMLLRLEPKIPPDVEAELPDVSTVGGMVSARLGHIAREGETFTWGGWTFEVIDIDGTRIDKVLARLAMPVTTT
ncbi:MAG: hemolysin family protein [Planctomycetota bacterium]|nr:hemolysin family protein [Planctomycetota bacterium]